MAAIPQPCGPTTWHQSALTAPRRFAVYGNHLPHCKDRKKANYCRYPSQKTVNNDLTPRGSDVRLCKCLESHLQDNAACKAIPSPTPESSTVSTETTTSPLQKPPPRRLVIPLRLLTCCAERKKRLKLPKTTEERSEANKVLKQQ